MPTSNQSGGEKFRGSSEVPLTTEGIQSAQDVALALAKRGGLDELQTSSLGRTIHTAKIISQYTHAPITYIGNGLHPWHLGPLEGQDVTPDLLAYQKHLVTEAPDEIPQGRGAQSTADGESFNQFKGRTLPFLQKVISQASIQPDRKIGVVTHYRVRRLLDAWMRGGMDPNGSVDTEVMTSHDGQDKPGSLQRLSVDPYAGPQISSVDLDNPASLQGGIYLIRHGKTGWN